MTSELSDIAALREDVKIITALLAMLVASPEHSLEERATRLRRAGMQPKQIAEILGSTSNAVSVALSTAKKRKKR